MSQEQPKNIIDKIGDLDFSFLWPWQHLLALAIAGGIGAFVGFVLSMTGLGAPFNLWPRIIQNFALEDQYPLVMLQHQMVTYGTEAGAVIGGLMFCLAKLWRAGNSN